MPSRYGLWSGQLLADEMVAMEVVESNCLETVRETLKKRHDQTQDRILGSGEHEQAPDEDAEFVADRENVLNPYAQA